MKRPTQPGNYEPIIVACTPECSWRATVRTRWLNKLRSAGASLKEEGPEGPIAPVVTNGSQRTLEHGPIPSDHSTVAGKSAPAHGAQAPRHLHPGGGL